MEPRALVRGKKLHLVYDLGSTRVRCSALLSTPAPNGGSVLLYGHDDGLTILWRGGRRLRQASAEPQADESIVITRDSQDEPEYEEEEELDTDLQFPRIHHSFDIAFDQPVTKITLLEAPEQRRQHTSSVKVVIATLRGRIQLLDVPLHIPTADHTDIQAAILENAIMLKTTTTYVRSLTSKATYEEGVTFTISAITDRLELWQVAETAASEEDVQYVSLAKSDTLATVTSHPGLQSAQVLVTDKLGTVSAYDLASGQQSDAWLYTLSTSFEATATNPPARKRLIDAQFVLGGRGIFALTCDGQWGIWDTTAAQGGKALDEFVLSGYLDSATAPASADSNQKRSTALTPMTPNTRKTKSENFFAAPQSRKEAVPSGGLSIVRAATSTGAIDESIMIWYQSSIYNIPSMQAFWQRSTSGTGGLGSLHTPGIASVLGVNLFGESITSLSQLPASSTASGIGQLGTQRDFVVSTEHRLIIVQSTGRLSTFTQALTKTDTRDQRMLDAGDLDIGGMDRLLDDMNGRNRKVGFAH